MPWACSHCKAQNTDDAALCGCGAAKTTWTVLADRTRTLSVARKRVTLERGADTRTRAPGDPALSATTLVAATRLAPVDTARAAEMAARGLLPATSQLLFVGLEGPGAARADVTLEVLFSTRPSEERVLPGPVPADGYVRVLFVSGPGAEGLAFPDVHVVDVTEAEADDGHAPTVEVSALGRPAQAVTLALPEFVLSM